MALVVKKLPVNAGDVRDAGLIPGLGRSPGEGWGSPLQYSWLENPMDRRAWWATVHGVAKSWTKLKWFSMHASIYLSPDRYIFLSKKEWESIVVDSNPANIDFGHQLEGLCGAKGRTLKRVAQGMLQFVTCTPNHTDHMMSIFMS